MTCRTCRHFKPLVAEKDSARGGNCRRYPPTVNWSANADGVLIFNDAWPRVDEVDRCGEYSPASRHTAPVEPAPNARR